MSVMEAALPEEVAAPYRATLTKLQDAAPPMPASTVHEILAVELGPRWRTAKFLDFDDRPVASASIGQVHRATWRDGREVAVKIQYPGAGPALLSDLTQLSRVARMAGTWIPGVDIGPIMDELRSRMQEELNYRIESGHQRAFAKAFRDDPDVAVPDVLASSEQVIVSEWLEGTPLSQIIANGTAAQRDEAAALYLEFLLRGPNRARLLHADPHPGNFRITPDGRLGVMDFGAVDRLPDGLPVAMGALVSLALAGDAQGLADGLRAEGFVRPNVSIAADQLLGFLQPFLEPMRHELFTVDRAWLRAQAARIQDPRRPDFLVGTRLNLPPDYLLIHRVWLGGIGVLSQIGGTIPMRDLLIAHLPGIDEDALPDPEPARTDTA
jgi:predicted unusual protein kinase regulating ubiquinone biosynthesis (AarF/ABC1/UbiB family)